MPRGKSFQKGILVALLAVANVETIIWVAVLLESTNVPYAVTPYCEPCDKVRQCSDCLGSYCEECQHVSPPCLSCNKSFCEPFSCTSGKVRYTRSCENVWKESNHVQHAERMTLLPLHFVKCVSPCLSRLSTCASL